MKLINAITALPVDLQEDVRRSLGVPQHGPHHNEGPFLDSHLRLVPQAMSDAAAGIFHEAVPEAVRPAMRAAAQAQASLASMYVLLHDVDKANCLTLVYHDGRTQAIAWAEWLDFAGPAARDGGLLGRFCREQGIKQISYYQETEDGTRHHGRVAAERLTGRKDIPSLIVKAIETHEIAFWFGAKGGINIPLFTQTFGDWPDDEVAFALLVNYADQVGSHDEEGEPDVGDFVLLAKTYVAAKQYGELAERLKSAQRVDRVKLGKALDGLRKSVDALQSEDVEEAYRRIVAECALPTYEEHAVRVALAPLVDANQLGADLAGRLTDALVAEGQIPSELGRLLGAANKAVREAIAQIK